MINSLALHRHMKINCFFQKIERLVEEHEKRDVKILQDIKEFLSSSPCRK
jgi:hypothetical protein